MPRTKTNCKRCRCYYCDFKGDCHCPIKGRKKIAPAICANFWEVDDNGEGEDSKGSTLMSEL